MADRQTEGLRIVLFLFIAADVIASEKAKHVTSCSDVWDLDDDDRRLLIQLWLRDHYNSAVELFTRASTEYNDICGEIQVI